MILYFAECIHKNYTKCDSEDIYTLYISCYTHIILQLACWIKFICVNFKHLYNIPLDKYNINLFLHAPIDEYLGWYTFYIITNNNCNEFKRLSGIYSLKIRNNSGRCSMDQRTLLSRRFYGLGPDNAIREA